MLDANAHSISVLQGRPLGKVFIHYFCCHCVGTLHLVYELQHMKKPLIIRVFFSSAQNSQRMVIVSAGNAEALETIKLSESETWGKRDFSDHRKIIFRGVSEIDKKRKMTLFKISVIHGFLIQISFPSSFKPNSFRCFNCFC